MKKINFYIVLTAIMLFFASTGCKNKSFDEDVENLNKGEITLYVDTSYSTLVGELIKSYENVYPEAKIHAVFTGDKEILNAFLTDKTQMIITGRSLNNEELEALKQTQKFIPKQYVIASEAIAIITSINNPDSLFDMEEFAKSRNAGYNGIYLNRSFVFNKSNSGIINQLVAGKGSSMQNMFSLENRDTLSAYIAANNQAIGFISFAEISDMDDPIAQALLKGIKVLPVKMMDEMGKIEVIELSQSTIATNKYPLQRSVTVVKGNTPQLLGTGFVNFMYRSKASRIILKEGLIPTKMPEREIKIVE